MGFFSSIFKSIKKGLKSIWKGAKKIVKKVFKFTKKVWDKFRKSTIGKIIMVAAAVYFGGVALGAWGGGGTAATGVATTTLGATPGVTAAGVSTVTGSTTALGVETALAGESLFGAAPGLVAPAAAAAAPGLVTAAAPIAGSSVVAATTPNLFGAAPGAVAPVPSTVLGSEMLGSAVDWAAANPALTIAGGKAISAMAQPDPYDEWRKQREWERANSNIAGIRGDDSGEPIGMGLIRQAQAQDLYTPTYQQGT